MDVLAAVATGAGKPFEFRTLSLDDPRDDEVRVRIVGVGVCHTDIVFKEGEMIPPPVVLGHEGSGIVEAVGSKVTKVAPGDRVAMTFRSCGHCSRCDRGDAAYCETMPMLNYIGMRTDGSRTLHDGDTPVGGSFFGQSSFATHAITYERNLVKVPDDLPLALIGPLGCGIQTGAGGVMRSLACEAGSSLLITGGGPVGLSAVMGAKIRGCKTIILVEPLAGRRDLAIEFGATHDTSGVPAVQQAVMGALASKGVFGIVGIAPPGTPTPGDINTIMTYGHTVKGIIEGDSDPDVFLPELMEHWRAGRLPFDRLIRTFPFSEINEAIAAQHHGDCIKVVLLMDEA
jgi:aryl-alcohol dehydrogenase